MRTQSTKRRLGTVLAGAVATVAALIAVTSPTGAAFRATTSTTATLSTGAFPSYSDIVRQASPIGYYKLDDAVGSARALDSSGLGNDAQLVHTATTWRQAGSPAGSADGSTALVLPGARSQLVSQNRLNLAATDPVTFELWFEAPAATAGLLAGLGSDATGDSTQVVRALRMDAGGKVVFQVDGDSVSTPASLADGAWHLAHASLGPAGMQLWIDGVLVGAVASRTSSTVLTPGYLHVGGDGTYFAGAVDEVAAYRSQLTPAQVVSHWTARGGSLSGWTAAVTADHPWSLWHLEEDPQGPWGHNDPDYPVTLADSSGSSHPGTARYVAPPSGVYGQAPALTGTDPGTARRVDGTGWGYSTTSFTVPPTLTYELWFKTAVHTGGTLAVFSSSGDPNCRTGGQCGRFLVLRDDGSLEFGIKPGTAVESVRSTTGLDDGAWHYVVATTIVPAGATQAELRLYVDNALNASAVVSKPNTFTGHFAFGGGGVPPGYNPSTSASFRGTLDEVAVYSTTLTAEQMSTHFYARSRNS